MKQHKTAQLRTLAAGLVVLAGCYNYVPVAPAVPEPGNFIRADVSDAASTRLTGTLGPGVLQLRGMVIGRTDDELSLVISSYSTTRSGELAGNNEAVRLSFGEIRQLQQKKLSKGKSIILGAAFLGGAVLVTSIVADNSRILDDQDNPDPGGTDRRRTPVLLPFLKIRFP